jgi:hypothetical protein
MKEERASEAEDVKADDSRAEDLEAEDPGAEGGLRPRCQFRP